jgi:hypothetical protein
VPAGDTSTLSNRSVLLLTFALAVAAGLAILFARAGWRRLWWWRRYHESSTGGRTDEVLLARPVPTRVDPRPGNAPNGAAANGSNGAAANGAHGTGVDDEESVSVAGRATHRPTDT